MIEFFNLIDSFFFCTEVIKHLLPLNLTRWQFRRKIWKIQFNEMDLRNEREMKWTTNWYWHSDRKICMIFWTLINVYIQLEWIEANQEWINSWNLSQPNQNCNPMHSNPDSNEYCLRLILLQQNIAKRHAIDIHHFLLFPCHGYYAFSLQCIWSNF